MLSLADKIFKRHELLTKYFVTKPSEDESFESAWVLVCLSTSLIIVFCILEAASYFLYSYKVRELEIYIKIFINYGLLFMFSFTLGSK